MEPGECNICLALQGLGVKNAPCEDSPWIGSEPAGIDALEIFAPGSGHQNTVQIRRCQQCGTLYRYRYHSEYDVSGSWDEYFFWRMSPSAQVTIGHILQLPGELQAQALKEALLHPQADVREDAALLSWILVDRGDAFGTAPLQAICQGLEDEAYLVGNYCYRALLSYAYRGRAESGALASLLTEVSQGRNPNQFRDILVRECAMLNA